MTCMSGDRERLRATFESAARLYDLARPSYPPELFDELARLAELQPGARLLEVGCGTGQATLPLARRGYQITCIEIGAKLAELARHNVADIAGVEIVQSAFESWRPPADVTYDLVFAATSWHWLDPMVRYRRAWQLLRSGGRLAVWTASHVFPAGGDPFFGEIQDVYDAIGEGLPPGSPFPRPGDMPDWRDEIEASGLFDDTEIRQFDWEVSYDAESYIRLLETFSGHIAMEQRKRDKLYGEIRRRLALRPDHPLRRHWGAVLHVAKRRDSALPGV
jgi:SAM-dependent methyltransferase